MCVELFGRMIQDDQDSVRLLAVESSVFICKSIEKEDCAHLIMPILMNDVVSDRSWRVRYTLADKYVQLQKNIDPELCNQQMVNNYIKLLKVSIKYFN